MLTFGTALLLTVLMSLLMAAPGNQEPLGTHLAAWIRRCDFVGFVRPCGTSEPIQFDVPEPHGTMVNLTRGGEVLIPNEAGDIVVARDAFWKVRCEVERVGRVPDRSRLSPLPPSSTGSTVGDLMTPRSPCARPCCGPDMMPSG